MIKLKNIPKGYKIIGGVALSPVEVEFYQLLANDETVIEAAELVLLPKRTCEQRMYTLQNHLGVKTRHGLITILLRKKIIK